ncbi:MAG: hypothetical protein HQ475_05620 [SAR202 cluster bacterium]|nr:hypothetical protein [SAR202 cluster bacterium]
MFLIRRPESLVIVSALIFTVALNLPHEIAHGIGFYFSGLPSCVHWNITTPTGGIQLETIFLWGVLSGPLLHFLVGVTAATALIRFRRFKLQFLGIISAAWLIRPFVVLNEVLSDLGWLGVPSNPVDEMRIRQILESSFSSWFAWGVFGVFVAVPLVGFFVGFWKGTGFGDGPRRLYLAVGGFVGMMAGTVVVLSMNSLIGDISIFGSCP